MALPIQLTQSQAKAMGITVESRPRRKAPLVPGRKTPSRSAGSSLHRFAMEVASKSDDPLIAHHAELLNQLYKKSPGQAILSLAALRTFADQVKLEFRPIKGRQIQLDLALPEYKIAIEVNGWTNHGKSLDAFKSDHLRTRDLMADGWIIIPFTATESRADPEQCLTFVRMLLDTHHTARRRLP